MDFVATPPVFADLTPETKARLDRFRDEHANDPIGGVGGRILLEDENVRIWELILEPGEAADLHKHEYDYYPVIFEGDYVAGVTPEEGNTVAIPKGGLEWVRNVGQKRYPEIIVELKRSQGRGR